MPITAPHNPQEKVQSLQLDFEALCDVVPQRSALPFLSLHALPSSQAGLLALRCTRVHIHTCPGHFSASAHAVPAADNALPSKPHADLGSNTGSSTDVRL